MKYNKFNVKIKEWDKEDSKGLALLIFIIIVIFAILAAVNFLYQEAKKAKERVDRSTYERMTIPKNIYIYYPNKPEPEVYKNKTYCKGSNSIIYICEIGIDCCNQDSQRITINAPYRVEVVR